MNFKRVMAGSVIGAGMLASPAVFAGATGNVGAFSEYMFRGIEQTSGATVQGGLDYAHDSGLYVGTWASNNSLGYGTEVDLYGGYAAKFGGLGLDVGGIYYWYSEEDEADADLNTFEIYLGASYGPVAVKYYYADEANFFLDAEDSDEAGYLLGTLALPITSSINFTASVGIYDGDEVETYLESLGSTDDKYIDYSIGLAKTIDGGMTFTLQLIDTDIETESEDGSMDDEPKVVVGFKKSFDL